MAVDALTSTVRAGLVTELMSKPAGRRLWPSVWPKLLAVALVVAAWQVCVWTKWKPEYVVPSPFTVFDASSRTTSAPLARGAS